MTRLKCKRLLSLAITLLLVFQAMPLGMPVAAEGGGTLLASEKYAIHKSGYTPEEQSSSIVIKDKGGNVIATEIDGSYKDIPAQSTIDFQVGFHLIENEALEYCKPGEYFDVPLPGGLLFAGNLGGTIKSGSISFADWTIIDAAGGGKALRVTLNDGMNNDALGENVWGVVGFTGKFDYLKSEGDTDAKTEITFGDQTIIIERKPFVDDQEIKKGSLAKSGLYNAASNEIIWTVTVTPALDGNLNGYTLIDTLTTANHTYKADTLKVNDIGVSPDADSTGSAIKYTFSNGLTTAQTVTYVTTPNAGAFSVTQPYVFKNQADMQKNGEGASTNKPEATVSVSGFFGKVSQAMEINQDSGTAYVQWKVTVTIPAAGGVYTLPNAKITDTLQGAISHAYAVDDSAHPVEIKMDGAGTPTPVAHSADKGDYEIVDGHLVYQFPDGQPQTKASGTATYVLTYWTKVANWDTSLDSNSAVPVKNSASFTWEPTGGAGPGVTIGSGIAQKEVVPAGGLLSKALGPTEPANNETYQYNVAGEYVQWSLKVNSNKINLGQDVTLADVVPAGLDFVIDGTHSLAIAGGSGTIKSFSGEDTPGGLTLSANAKGFTLNLNTATGQTGVDITQAYTVTFWTKLNAEGLAKFYANGDNTNKDNDTVSFVNGATLTYKGKTATASATKKYSTEMVKKTAGAYNYDTRLVQWTVVINRNKLPLNGATAGGAVISDSLMAGMTLYVDEAHPFVVTPEDGGPTSAIDAPHGGTGYSVTLPQGTVGKYTITFWTHVEDSLLLAKGGVNLDNTATLALENGVSIFDSARRTIQNPVIIKGHDYTGTPDGNGNLPDTITWTIQINPARANLMDAVVTDTLNGGLGLIENSVELYKAAVNSATGALTKSGTALEKGTAADQYRVVVNGQDFSVHLPDGRDAYILVFKTVIRDGIANLENTVHFDGTTGSPAGSDKVTGITVADPYQSGGSGSQMITIKKVGLNGEALSNVGFTLMTAKGEFKYRGGAGAYGTTNDGVADPAKKGTFTFDKLPDWTFYFKEDPATVPAGYLALAAPVGGVKPSQLGVNDVYEMTNVLGKATVAIAKVGANDMPLSGGKFTLTGTSTYDKQPFTIADVPAVNGMVTFSDVPLGSYTVTETEAPTGHQLGSAPIAVVVDYNGDKTGTVVTYNGSTTGKFVNEPTAADATRVSFKKTDLAGVALSGGSFLLSGKDYKNKDVSMTTAAAANGTVSFDGVTIGTYTIREITPPGGYLRPVSDTILSVTVAYNALHTGLDVAITGEGGAYNDTQKTFKNAPALADVTFNKVHSTNASLKISGGTFEIRGMAATNVEFVATATAKDGVVIFKDIPVNANGASYTIKELAAPGGYLSTKETLTVTVSYKDNQTAVATPVFSGKNGDTLKNDPAPMGEPKARISVLKTDEKGNKLAGAVFTIAYRNGAEVLQTATTGSDGIALFEGIVLYKEYTIRETAAPKGYKLSDTEINLNPQKENETYAFTVVNQAIDQKGSVSVLKTDEKGNKLAGATFTLYDKDGAAVASAVSDADGIAKFADIPANAAYTIRETAAPKGYERSEQVLVFTLEKDAALSFTMVNRKIVDKGSVSVLKTDEKGGRLAGATFTLYDKDGAAVASAVSDADGIAKFADIPANAAYTIRETAAPKGYERSEQVLSLTLEKNAALSFTMVNRKISENQVQTYGSLTIMKVGPNNVRLADAEFTLYDAAGKRVMSTVTGEDGMAKFTNLALGSYSVRETRAPAGYQLADKVLTVTIGAERLNKKFTLHNAKVGEEPEVAGWEEIIVDIEDGELPYTGSTFGDQFFLLAGVSLLAIGFVTLLPHKKGGKHLADPAKK